MLDLICDYSSPPGEIVPSLRGKWHRRFTHHRMLGLTAKEANEMATADIVLETENDRCLESKPQK